MKDAEDVTLHLPPTSDQSLYPTFQLNKSRFDQTTFQGRLRHFLDVIDPRTLFVRDAQLHQCVRLLEEYKDGTLPPGVSNRHLWEAQKIKQATLHPDTGEKTFIPFRMAGVIPFGTPFVIALLLPNPTLAHTVFWQWAMQTYNSGMNFANRNASKPTPTSRFVAGYLGAVGSAVSITVGLSVIIKRANSLNPAMKIFVQKFVALPAVVTAGVCNVVLMRNNELSEGIQVVDEHHQVVGTSQLAAKQALLQISLSRAALASQIFLIPPLALAILERTSFLRRNPRFHLVFNTLLSTLACAIALPISLAMFPQMSAIKRSHLEPHLQAATTEDILYYNKGL